ncbi:hypothetical protein HAPS_1861 [Glaesserella parasuis SH0165]|uniref:Uncharacterized protein n=2 Tax=Glaesserella parasuis TaxID=738 RepID=B8F7Q5_GLAP5|nr:hypothetical protein HAPS_1861 [Glaesserella parasuis SH0165]
MHKTMKKYFLLSSLTVALALPLSTELLANTQPTMRQIAA